jgi:hypothetical protein
MLCVFFVCLFVSVGLVYAIAVLGADNVYRCANMVHLVSLAAPRAFLPNHVRMNSRR